MNKKGRRNNINNQQDIDGGIIERFTKYRIGE